MVSAGAVSCAVRGPIGPGHGNGCRIASERTRERRIQTNPTAPHALAPSQERTRTRATERTRQMGAPEQTRSTQQASTSVHERTQPRPPNAASAHGRRFTRVHERPKWPRNPNEPKQHALAHDRCDRASPWRIPNEPDDDHRANAHRTRYRARLGGAHPQKRWLQC
jgi:hypothetical protein